MSIGALTIPPIKLSIPFAAPASEPSADFSHVNNYVKELAHVRTRKVSIKNRARQWVFVAGSRKVLRKSILGVLFAVLVLSVIEFKLVFFFNVPWKPFWGVYSTAVAVYLLSRFVIVSLYHDNHTRNFDKTRYPSVSFIIATKNEEQSIAQTIQTCLDSSYPGPIEVIAVNDGSTDGTQAAMERAARSVNHVLRWVRVLSFPENRGKREAMSEGVLAACGEIVVFVDSDSFAQKNALRTIVEHFVLDPRIGAVSGNTVVENRDVNLLTKMQAARYGVSFDIFKAAESVFGVVTCCPGCFSAYRRIAVLEVLNEWRHQTFAGTRSTFGDDRSLTNYILRNWRVTYCAKARASTIVPERYPQFFKQQFRWKKSWLREGAVAATFMWKKHPVASVSFYTNLILPLAAPAVAFRSLIVGGIAGLHFPLVFLAGVVVMSTLFGIFHELKTNSRSWLYLPFFSLLYSAALIWQMPYAIARVRDTRWGTR